MRQCSSLDPDTSNLFYVDLQSMPRRRRKKSNVPALLFAESPVNIVHRMPSPVYCADNPPTADVVSIDGDVNLPWVGYLSNVTCKDCFL